MDRDTLLLEAEERMEKAVEVLVDKYRGMRTGRANPGLIESVRVDYYGTMSPLKQIATISAPEPDLLVIKPFDASSLQSIEKAIQKSDVGIQPTTDGRVIRLKVPPLSEERRKQLVSRAYFPDDPANGEDPVLALVPQNRRDTLIAKKKGDVLEWNVILQGSDETVFFDC